MSFIQEINRELLTKRKLLNVSKDFEKNKQHRIKTIMKSFAEVKCVQVWIISKFRESAMKECFCLLLFTLLFTEGKTTFTNTFIL